MRGIFVFLIMITIVMLGLAGCPKPAGTPAGNTPGTPANTGDASSEGATDGGE
jgi:hypothetical protein